MLNWLLSWLIEPSRRGRGPLVCSWWRQKRAKLLVCGANKKGLATASFRGNAVSLAWRSLTADAPSLVVRVSKRMDVECAAWGLAHKGCPPVLPPASRCPALVPCFQGSFERPGGCTHGAEGWRLRSLDARVQPALAPFTSPAPCPVCREVSRRSGIHGEQLLRFHSQPDSF